MKAAENFLNSFDKDLIKTVVFDLLYKNECITLKKLKSYLEKNHNIKHFQIQIMENIT